MLERAELEAFLTLAEELHFGRTADRMYVTTGRISQIIRKLERRVGAPLFERNTRLVTLTPIGRQLRDDVLPADQQIRTALRNARARAGGVGHILHVGYSEPWCGDLVLGAADSFQAAHPGSTVTVREVLVHDAFHALRTGAIDIQLTDFPIAETDLTTGPVVFSEPRSLAVPATHAFAVRRSVTLDDLTATALIVTAATMPTYWLDHHFPRHTPAGHPIRRGPTTTYRQDALVHVAAGRGVLPVSARATRYFARPGIAFVPFRDTPPVEYGLLWHSNQDSPVLRTFIDIVTAAMDQSQNRTR